MGREFNMDPRRRGAEEPLLGRILGIVILAKQAVQKAEQALLVAPDQLLEHPWFVRTDARSARR